jgi:hypothetical protein
MKLLSVAEKDQMVKLLHQRAEDQPGYHNGITPWPECNGCMIENAADALDAAYARIAQLESEPERLQSALDAACAAHAETIREKIELSRALAARKPADTGAKQ